MAKVLELTDGTTLLDLLANLQLASEGFTYRAEEEDYFWTVFRLFSVAGESTVRSEQKKIDDFYEQARLYAADVSRDNPVWLYWQSEGEGVKRLLVQNISTEIMTGMGSSPLMGHEAAFLSLGVYHKRDAEDNTVDNISTTGVSAHGGTWAIGSANGTRPQRIATLEVTSPTSPTLTKFWIGIRDIRKGTAGFVPVWEAENGINATDAADAADAAASGGNRVTISFATTPTLAKRFTLQWQHCDLGSNYDDIIGRYLVLGRLRLDAGTTEVMIELKHGWGGLAGRESSVGQTFVSAVEDANLTNYNLVPLGVVDIPPTGNRDSIVSGDNSILHYALFLYAERLSGSGALYFDCFILIPADHLLTAQGAYVGNSGGRGPLYVWTGADDHQVVVNRDAPGGTLGNVADFSLEDWFYPVGGGLLVAAAQEEGVHALTPTLNLAGTLYPRWRTFRT